MLRSEDPAFHTTRWTVVLEARGQEEEALEDLCRRYWYPLYVFVRRRGHGAADAEDLTQEFFARLLEKKWLDAVDRDRGKFRSFLMMAMKRFLANEWDRSQSLKRGGGATHFSLDMDGAEERYAEEPGEPADEALVYDRRWALTLLDRSLRKLEDEEEGERFAVLKQCLTAERGGFDCAGAGSILGMSEGAVRVAVHRLRKRFREIFRAEIAETVADAGDLDGEMRYLAEILAKG
ncbi:MAG: sigma-70 family RNA polymerase sigma factor [Verrucomicrobiota bacterium]